MPLNLSDNGQSMDQMLCILRADAASFLDQLRLIQLLFGFGFFSRFRGLRFFGICVNGQMHRSFLLQYARKRKEPYIRSMPSGKKGWAMRQTGCRTTHRYTSLL